MLALAAGGWVAPGGARAPWQKNEYQLQKEHMARFEPAPLVAPRRSASGSPTVIRMRFYADDDFRAGGARWADRLKARSSR